MQLSQHAPTHRAFLSRLFLAPLLHGATCTSVKTVHQQYLKICVHTLKREEGERQVQLPARVRNLAEDQAVERSSTFREGRYRRRRIRPRQRRHCGCGGGGPGAQRPQGLLHALESLRRMICCSNRPACAGADTSAVRLLSSRDGQVRVRSGCCVWGAQGLAWTVVCSS